MTMRGVGGEGIGGICRGVEESESGGESGFNVRHMISRVCEVYLYVERVVFLYVWERFGLGRQFSSRQVGNFEARAPNSFLGLFELLELLLFIQDSVSGPAQHALLTIDGLEI
jgi:hypothetical protein